MHPAAPSCVRVTQCTAQPTPRLLCGLPVEVVHQPKVELLPHLPPVGCAHQQAAVAAKQELQAAHAAGREAGRERKRVSERQSDPGSRACEQRAGAEVSSLALKYTLAVRSRH
jgi:hypothetical protein